MARYGDLRIPEHYDPKWSDRKDMNICYQWWHLGYEDGVSHTKWDYGIKDTDSEEDVAYRNELEQLKQENRALRSLIGANVRIMKEEIRKEMEEESRIASQSQLEGRT